MQENSFATLNARKAEVRRGASYDLFIKKQPQRKEVAHSKSTCIKVANLRVHNDCGVAKTAVCALQPCVDINSSHFPD